MDNTNKDYYKNNKYKYIKLWIILFVIITIIYLIYLYCNSSKNENLEYSQELLNNISRNYFLNSLSNTGKYIPPLNFGTTGQNFMKVGDIIKYK
jgi:hypothetical protein